MPAFAWVAKTDLSIAMVQGLGSWPEQNQGLSGYPVIVRWLRLHPNFIEAALSQTIRPYHVVTVADCVPASGRRHRCLRAKRISDALLETTDADRGA